MTEDNDVDAILARMKSSVGVKTDGELARYLDIDPSSVAAWRRRNKIPPKHLIRVKALGVSYLSIVKFDQQTTKVHNAYAFELVGLAGPILRKEIKVGDAAMTTLWIGFRLARLFRHALLTFDRCDPDDRSDLEQTYQGLRERIEAGDLYEWIETLPDDP